MFRSIRDHMTSGRGIAATLAVILTFGLAQSGTAAAAVSDGHHEQRPKPTIVFVHGGWADSSGWNDEITNLERRDYPVIAPANPLRSLASDAAYIRSVLQTISGPIVLVGHSYGGAVISNAAVGVPNVKALVVYRSVCSRQGRVAAAARDDEPWYLDRAAHIRCPSISVGGRQQRCRPVPEKGGVPRGIRRRSPAQGHRPDARHTATILQRRVHVAVR